MKTSIIIILTIGLITGCGDFTKTKLANSPGASSSSSSVTAQNGWEDLSYTQFSEEKMAVHLTNKVLLPLYHDFGQSLELLDNKVSQYCENTIDSLQEEVKNQWWATTELFHQFELFDIGPFAGENGPLLKKDFSTWPDFTSCTIDKEVALMAKTASTYQLKSIQNRKTLTTLEYLLFTGQDHSCPRLRPTEDLSLWTKKTTQEKRADRCRYMKLVTTDLLTQNKALQRRWDYYTQASLSLESFIQEMSDSFFYVDILLKDQKTGSPLGLTSNCDTGQCVDQVEHLWSNKSLAALKANFDGLQFLLYGDRKKDGTPFGLYAFMIRRNKKETYQKFQTIFKNFEKNIADLQTRTNFADLVRTNDPAACGETTSTKRSSEGCAVHADIKLLSDFIKLDFVVALSTKVAKQAEGDSD